MEGPDFLQYNSTESIYALDMFSGCSETESPILPFPADLKLCMGTYAEAGTNSIKIAGLHPRLLQDPRAFAEEYYSPDGDDEQRHKAQTIPGHDDFRVIAEQALILPVSKVAFAPKSLLTSTSTSAELGRESFTQYIATTSDALRVWSLTEAVDVIEGGFVGRQSPVLAGVHIRLAETYIKQTTDVTPAPLTSCDWCSQNPKYVVTSSTNGTCSLWDLTREEDALRFSYVDWPDFKRKKKRSRLCFICSVHDREVLDVAWFPFSETRMATASADGSVRSIDKRSPDSMVLYEVSTSGGSTPDARSSSGASSNKIIPIMRVACNPADPNMLAVVRTDQSDILILDVRNPGYPVAELRGHGAAVNGIAWKGVPSNSCVYSGSDSIRAPNHVNNNDGPALASISDDCQVLLWDIPVSSTQRSGGSKGKGRTWSGIPVAASRMSSPIENIVWHAGRDYMAVTTGNRVRCLRV